MRTTGFIQLEARVEYSLVSTFFLVESNREFLVNNDTEF